MKRWIHHFGSILQIFAVIAVGVSVLCAIIIGLLYASNLLSPVPFVVLTLVLMAAVFATVEWYDERRRSR